MRRRFEPVFPAKSLGAGNFPCPTPRRPGRRAPWKRFLSILDFQSQEPIRVPSSPRDETQFRRARRSAWASRSRRRALDRRLRRLAPQLAVDVERAFDPDRVEIRLEPSLGVLPAEVAQLLQEGPGHVEFGRRVVALESSRAANAVQALEPVVLALQN